MRALCLVDSLFMLSILTDFCQKINKINRLSELLDDFLGQIWATVIRWRSRSSNG